VRGMYAEHDDLPVPLRVHKFLRGLVRLRSRERIDSCESPRRPARSFHRQSSSSAFPSISILLFVPRYVANQSSSSSSYAFLGLQPSSINHSHRWSTNSSRRLRKLTYRQMIFIMQRLYQIYIEQNNLVHLLLRSSSHPPYHFPTKMIPPRLHIYPSQLIGANP
jgi:hypothetical protein